MFPPIALLSSLIILIGQIPGYSASGEASSSTNERNNPVREVQRLLDERYFRLSDKKNYREAIELATELATTQNTDEKVRKLLQSISQLSVLGEGLEKIASLQCNEEVLSSIMGVRSAMNDASRRNEFIDEAAKHPLNRMINNLTDMVFEKCASAFDKKIEELRLRVHEDKAKDSLKFALMNLDRFKKFLKLPATPKLIGPYKNQPYSALAIIDEYIDLNTELEPEDLEWLGVPKESTLSRNELLERLIEGTCNLIDKDEELKQLFVVGLSYLKAASSIYEYTGREYYFRSEFGYHRICRLVADSITTVMDED